MRLINVWRICSRRSGTKSLARPDKKNSKPTAARARRMPTHSNECSSLTKLRTHDIDERVKFNSRAVNEIERLIRGSQRNWRRECFLQPRCCAATNCFGRKHHVKNDTRSFAGSGVHLRDSERARTAADHQPTLTPQDSGTTNGLIAVWPVIHRWSGHPVATAHSPSPLTAGKLGTRASCRR